MLNHMTTLADQSVYIEGGRAISVHRFLLRAALALANMFAWLLIFNYSLYFTRGQVPAALFFTIFWYIVTQVVTFIALPLTSRYVQSGMQRAIGWATMMLCVAFLWLAASFLGYFGHSLRGLALGFLGFAVFSGLYRACYFVPYAVSSERLSGWRPYMSSLFELFLAVLPIAGGILIGSSARGSVLVLFGAVILLMLSLIPLAQLPAIYERYDWSYTETMRRFFSRRSRALAVISILEGIQGAGLLLVWPLIAFAIVGWSYPMVGIVISVSLLFAIAFKKLFSFIHTHMHTSPLVVSGIAMAAWLLRLLAYTPVSVISADALYHTGTPSRAYNIDTITSEQSADGSHYLDEYTALKQMGLALGRISICVAAGILMFYVSALAAFAMVLIVAAIAAAISVFLVQEIEMAH